MKNMFKLFGVIALVAIIGFSMAACDDGSDSSSGGGGGGGGGGGSQTATYTGKSGDATYTLKITENTARYSAQSGDAYELIFGTKKSTGTVSNVEGGKLTLTPSNALTALIIAIISGNNLTSLTGTITWSDNSTADAPGALTTGGNQGNNSNAGVLTFTDGISSSALDLRSLIIIANSTNTSVSNWQDNTQQVAHYNKAFNNQQETDTTLRLSVPYKNQTVSNDNWSTLDTAWTGSGTYAIYVFYWNTWLGSSVEKILNNVTFNNGCATVTSSNFQDL